MDEIDNQGAQSPHKHNQILSWVFSLYSILAVRRAPLSVARWLDLGD